MTCSAFNTDDADWRMARLNAHCNALAKARGHLLMVRVLAPIQNDEEALVELMKAEEAFVSLERQTRSKLPF